MYMLLNQVKTQPIRRKELCHKDSLFRCIFASLTLLECINYVEIMFRHTGRVGVVKDTLHYDGH